MRSNRSMPASTIIPELGYRNVDEAAQWLCAAFGFTVRLRIPGHRVQLVRGAGTVIARETPAWDGACPPAIERSFAVTVRVDDLDRHFEQAMREGARLLRPPADYPYGERQYSCRDVGGHVWTFSQSIADVAPEDWGGIAS
ncbi:VOC family protein [Labrys monachus]|uniref:Glyoxalase superfamily protein PhnB n=1 Tax=Labrys monachus TaxID=217067 RepID=A0ABU0FJR3_9HYPH|nr:VOC family protein [Labrys monachus]MDQ0394854.1 putative glyoxalase superfamily protein PhnB [Labrys monachus]